MKKLNEVATSVVTVENEAHNVQFDIRIPVGMAFGEYMYKLQDNAANARDAATRAYATSRYQSIMRRSCPGVSNCTCRGPVDPDADRG